MGENTERFPCNVCGKSYLRKRHLNRHSKDECVGIKPRFNCQMCSSKFRRKYHLVRHLASKHGIISNPLQNIKLERLTKEDMHMSSGSENRDIKAEKNQFSVEALMMKQENGEVVPTVSEVPYNDFNLTDYAQLGLHHTFQNLQKLFVNYSLNNVSN